MVPGTTNIIIIIIWNLYCACSIGRCSHAHIRSDYLRSGLNLPKTGGGGFGRKTFNELPLDLRKAETLNDFNAGLQDFLNL